MKITTTGSKKRALKQIDNESENKRRRKLNQTQEMEKKKIVCGEDYISYFHKQDISGWIELDLLNSIYEESNSLTPTQVIESYINDSDSESKNENDNDNNTNESIFSLNEKEDKEEEIGEEEEKETIFNLYYLTDKDIDYLETVITFYSQNNKKFETIGHSLIMLNSFAKSIKKSNNEYVIAIKNNDWDKLRDRFDKNYLKKGNGDDDDQEDVVKFSIDWSKLFQKKKINK